VRGASAAATAPVRPALTVLLLYLRPSPRLQILTLVASLGILAVEHQGEAGSAAIREASAADFTIVFAADDDPSASAIRALARASSTPVVACLPAGSAPRALLEAGATTCLADDQLEFTGATALLRVAEQARARRVNQKAPLDGHVFGLLAFDPALSALRRSDEVRPLSRSERAVLERLTATPGRPVDLRELERCAAPPGAGAQPGFLKAVVLRLRRKAEELGGDPELLRTVRGYGYVLAG
jgi:DNA-binding response OmpR family regulator